MSYDLASGRLVSCGLLLLAPLASAADTKTGWTEVKSAHVTLKTDLSVEAAERAIVLAERLRSALIMATWPGTKLPQERIELVVFSSHQDFQFYFGERVAHKVVLWGYPPTVYLFGGPESWVRRPSLEVEETTSPLKQAMAQHLATFIYRRNPKWFSVGLAEFLETLHIEADKKSAIVGRINRQAMSYYTSHRTFTVADALAWGVTVNPTDEGSLNGLFGLSWLMVQWMFDMHQDEFVRFQKLLVTGLDGAKAWKVVFPQATDLDQELYRFAQFGPFGAGGVELPEELRITSLRGRRRTLFERC